MAKRNRRTVAELLAHLEQTKVVNERIYIAKTAKLDERIAHLRTKFRKAALAAELLVDKSADEVLVSIEEQMASLREQRAAVKAAAR